MPYVHFHDMPFCWMQQVFAQTAFTSILTKHIWQSRENRCEKGNRNSFPSSGGVAAKRTGWSKSQRGREADGVVWRAHKKPHRPAIKNPHRSAL